VFVCMCEYPCVRMRMRVCACMSICVCVCGGWVGCGMCEHVCEHVYVLDKYVIQRCVSM